MRRRKVGNDVSCDGLALCCEGHALHLVAKFHTEVLERHLDHSGQTGESYHLGICRLCVSKDDLRDHKIGSRII